MKCIYCGEETENIINGEYVCLDCMNRLYVPCEYCGELHDKEKMLKTDMGYVCFECLESDFTRCFVCGEWLHNDYIRTARSDRHGGEVYVCEYCCANSYKFCVECEEYVEKEEGSSETFDGQWRCNECLNNSGYYMYCDGCDTYYRESDMTYSESSEEWLCSNCYEEDDSVIQS